MLHEYQDLIPKIKEKNARFVKIFENHAELDKEIVNIEEGREHMDRLKLETMKKEKLRLKDEAYQIILTYKQEESI